eukprot:1154350-Pelagomonas_calceolata.AAC.9
MKQRKFDHFGLGHMIQQVDCQGKYHHHPSQLTTTATTQVITAHHCRHHFSHRSSSLPPPLQLSQLITRAITSLMAAQHRRHHFIHHSKTTAAITSIIAAHHSRLHNPSQRMTTVRGKCHRGDTPGLVPVLICTLSLSMRGMKLCSMFGTLPTHLPRCRAPGLVPVLICTQSRSVLVFRRGMKLCAACLLPCPLTCHGSELQLVRPFALVLIALDAGLLSWPANIRFVRDSLQAKLMVSIEMRHGHKLGTGKSLIENGFDQAPGMNGLPNLAADA